MVRMHLRVAEAERPRAAAGLESLAEPRDGILDGWVVVGGGGGERGGAVERMVRAFVGELVQLAVRQHVTEEVPVPSRAEIRRAVTARLASAPKLQRSGVSVDRVLDEALDEALASRDHLRGLTARLHGLALEDRAAKRSKTMVHDGAGQESGSLLESCGEASSSGSLRSLLQSDSSAAPLVYASPFSSGRLPLDKHESAQQSGVPSLLELCIRRCGEYAATLPALNGGELADDVLQHMIRAFVDMNVLSRPVLARLVSPTMTSLDLTGCRGLRHAAFVAPVASLRRLTQLTLARCAYIGDADLAAMLADRPCDALRHVDLSHCMMLTDRALATLAEKGAGLRTVQLKGVRRLTAPALESLLEACGALEALVVAKVPAAGAVDWRKAPVGLKALDVRDVLWRPESARALDDTLLRRPRLAELRLGRFPVDPLRFFRLHAASLSVFHCSGGFGFDGFLTPISSTPIFSSPNIRTPPLAMDEEEEEDDRTRRMHRNTTAWPLSSHAFHLANTTSSNPVWNGLPPTNRMPPSSSSNPGAVLMTKKKSIPMMGRAGFPWKDLRVEECEVDDETLASWLGTGGAGLRRFSCRGSVRVGTGVLARLASHAVRLQTLDLGRTDVGDEALAALAASLPRLSRLVLDGCRGVSGAGLAGLVGLTELSCDDCAGLERLPPHAARLRRLAVGGCEALGSEALATALMQAHGALARLAVRELALRPASWQAVAHMQGLRRLDVSHVPTLTDDVLGRLAGSCRWLDVLDVSYCGALSRAGLQDALDRLPNLRKLQAHGLHCLDAVPLAHAGLAELHVAWCKRLLDPFLDELPAACASLLVLDVSYCSLVSGQAVHRLACAFPHLNAVHVRGCVKVPALTVRFLRSSGLWVDFDRSPLVS